MSREQEAKKKKKNQIILGIILVSVMFFSVIGYGFTTKDDNTTNNGNTVNYKGFSFIGNGLDFWSLKLGDFQFIFKNTPDNTTNLDSNINLINTYAGKPIYIQSINQEAEYEIYRNLDPIILRRQYACLNQSNITEIENFTLSNCDESLPIKNCKENFIIIVEAEQQEVKQIENCVFILDKRENIVKTSDEFLFKIIGVK